MKLFGLEAILGLGSLNPSEKRTAANTVAGEVAIRKAAEKETNYRTTPYWEYDRRKRVYWEFEGRKKNNDPKTPRAA